MSPTLEATLIQLIQVAMALIGAFVLLRVLRGTAVIKRKGLQLGGSAAVFVVILVLLNRYLPEIQRGILIENAAAQPVAITRPNEEPRIVKVSISPATQLVTSRDVDALDRNQFIVNSDLGIAVKRESDAAWEVKTFPSIDTVSHFDLPAFSTSYDMYQSIFFSEDIKPVIFGVRKIAGTEITINETSTVQSLPFSFNIFEDEKLLRKVMLAQVNMAVKMGAVPAQDSQDLEELVTKMENTAGKAIKAKFSEIINSSFPIKKDVHDGVFVTILTVESLNTGLIAKLQPESSLLDRALVRMALSGTFSGGFENLYVDQTAGIASFNSSVSLRKVVIAGNETDVRINHAGFIVAGQKRVMFVDLIYLSSDGIGVFEELQSVLNSLRFTG